MNKLPDGWEYKKLKDIGKVYTGMTPSTLDKKNFGNEHLFITPADINNDYKYIFNSIRKLSDKGFEKSRQFKKGDILYVSIGSTIGKIALAGCDFTCNQQINVLRVNEGIDNEFVYYQLINSFPYISKFVSRGVVPIMNKTTFENISIAIPLLLDEQKQIASALSKIDAYLENTIKLIEEKERFKKGIAKKLLTCKKGENVPEMRFKEFNDEWKEYNLSKIGISYSGLRNKKAKSFSENCNAKYITYKSIYDKSKIDINRLENVFVDKNENQNLVKYGDAFFTISSETPDEVAISSVLLDGVENTYLNSFCFGFRFDFNILLPEFARYYFRSDHIRKSTYKLAQGITRYNISKSKFLDIVIYLPSLKEQKEISEYLSLLDAEIDNLKKQEELIKEMKKGMINKLMSGEVRL